MSFKLLAIRPLEGCNKKFLKNLEENRIYKFYNEYEFCNNDRELTGSDKDDVTEIKFNQSIPENLYGDKINISAIVGKNGTGKSTLLELLYAYTFFLSKTEVDFIDDELIKMDKYWGTFSKERYFKELEDFEKLNVEVIYQDNKFIDIITLKNGQFNIRVLENDSVLKKFVKYKEKNKIHIKGIIESHKYFYSIALNYSFYGLNTKESGMYLKPLFHKNDGYQTPLVLNPMRTDGIIDVNRERDLTKSRLLYNLFFEDEFRNLSNGKIAKSIVFEFKNNKRDVEKELKELKENKDKYEYFADIYSREEELNTKTFQLIINHFFFKTYVYLENELNEITKNYIVNKTIKIVHQYENFFPNKEYFVIQGKYLDYDKKEKNNQYRTARLDFNEEKIKEAINKIFENYSHITFKLRQALIFLRYNNYLTFEDVINKKEFDIKILSNNISSIKKDFESFQLNEGNLKGLNSFVELEKDIKNFTDLTNCLPPAFLITDIAFENNQGVFEQLSSGEKQYIYALSTIIYHILNVSSVIGDDENKKYHYNNINIIFDEIELYFHPEMQRTFIFDLLKMISRIGTDRSLNFIFITHSPFILSDIPSQNIMFLEVEKNNDGEFISVQKQKDKTFGANIHDLLADSFFMSKEGYMGEFAKKKIKSAIDYLEKYPDKNNE